MDQRLSVITLGVEDVPRARAFYEQLGWKLTFTDGDIVMFQAGPMIISLWSRSKLAADAGVAAPPAGWGGFTLGYAVARRGRGRRRLRPGRRGRRDCHARARREVLRLLGRLRRSRRAHLGDPLGQGADAARGRHGGAADMTGTSCATGAWPAGRRRDIPVRAGRLGLQGRQRQDVRRQRDRAEPLDISVKCDPELAVALRARVHGDRRGLPPQQAPLDHDHARTRDVPDERCGSSSATATTS